MARPIRWTKRLWKLARGQDRMMNFYSRRETPLLLAYWQAEAAHQAREGYARDPLSIPLYRRLSDHKYRKQRDPDDDAPF